MHCSACGQIMDPAGTLCPRCGRPVAPLQPASPVPAASLAAGRVPRHLQTAGVLWITYAGWSVLQWLIVMPFLTHAFGWHNGHSYWGMGSDSFGWNWPHWLLPMITIAVLARAVLCLVTGIGLLRQARWARVLALVTAFLTLLKPLLGTALSIYTLWVLLPANSAREYEALAARL